MFWGAVRLNLYHVLAASVKQEQPARAACREGSCVSDPHVLMITPAGTAALHTEVLLRVSSEPVLKRPDHE